MGELESNALVLGKGKKERKEHWNRDTHIRESCANGASILGTSHLLPADWNGMKRNCRGRGREGKGGDREIWMPRATWTLAGRRDGWCS